MTVLLSQAGNRLTVKQLLDTLQETMDYESSMARKYATPVSILSSFLSLLLTAHNVDRRHSEGHTSGLCNPTFSVYLIRI